jgi:CheY-like chemotaxis protein
MPDFDGYQLIGRIRAVQNERRNVHAIALTACAYNDDPQRALLAGLPGVSAKV